MWRCRHGDVNINLAQSERESPTNQGNMEASGVTCGLTLAWNDEMDAAVLSGVSVRVGQKEWEAGRTRQVQRFN